MRAAKRPCGGKSPPSICSVERRARGKFTDLFLIRKLVGKPNMPGRLVKFPSRNPTFQRDSEEAFPQATKLRCGSRSAMPGYRKIENCMLRVLTVSRPAFLAS